MNLLEKVEEGITYQAYLQDQEGSLQERRESEKILNYVDLNLRRMRRIYKQYEPAPYLAKLIRQMNQPVTWLAITEGWCGDAAHVIPLLEKLSLLSFKPKLRIVYRDQQPELMDLFLTNGARSIPKILAIDEQGELIAQWGPRPSNAQKIVDDFKSGNSDYANYQELTEAVQKWYHYDRYLSFESEIVEFIEPQIRSKDLVKVSAG